MNPPPITNRRTVAQGADFYPTPAWATEALLAYETFEGTIWEPACGDGAMSKVLERAGYMVSSSDLHDYGYGTPGVDFLTHRSFQPDNIVTNPPFNLAESFVKQGLAHVQNKLCLLLRLAFLESATRYRSIYSITPPSRVYVFSERITMYPSGEKTAGSGTTAYGWFVWDLHAAGPPELRWIAPGFKEK